MREVIFFSAVGKWQVLIRNYRFVFDIILKISKSNLQTSMLFFFFLNLKYEKYYISLLIAQFKYLSMKNIIIF